MFIKTHGLKPSEFVQNVIEIIEEDKKTLAVARNVLRVHPADTSCKAHLVDIKQQAKIYLPEAFEKFLTKKSYSREFCKRSKDCSLCKALCFIIQYMLYKHSVTRNTLTWHPRLSCHLYRQAIYETSRFA